MPIFIFSNLENVLSVTWELARKRDILCWNSEIYFCTTLLHIRLFLVEMSVDLACKF